jgi:hypothetical protein
MFLRNVFTGLHSLISQKIELFGNVLVDKQIFMSRP